MIRCKYRPEKCNREGCDNDSAGVVVIKFRATKFGPAAKAQTALFVCKEHADKLEADDLIDDESWKQICDAFAVVGKMQPKRSLTTVHVHRFN